VLARLQSLREGVLEVVDGTLPDAPVLALGDPSGPLAAKLDVVDRRFWRAIVGRGGIGAAEAYAAGWWASPHPQRVARLMVRNRSVLEALEGGWARLGRPLLKMLHWGRRNTREGSRRNIAAHYDLGNVFFGLFLDPSMTYSSGVFAHPQATLEEASLHKLDRLCRLLDLRAEDHLLEIGTGWGSMAARAAGEFGCRVTTTTLSRSQAELARQRLRAAGLADRVEVCETDYRDLEGEYSKLVSVEMIEAVGHQNLGGYLKVCQDRVRADGLVAIQAITIADQHYAKALQRVDFIKRYIFPGSFIPSTTAILEAARDHTDLRLAHLSDHGADYARTLSTWRARLRDQWAAARAAGYSEEFLRMWEWYLAYCEGGFAEGLLSVVQLVFRRPGRGALPVGALDGAPRWNPTPC